MLFKQSRKEGQIIGLRGFEGEGKILGLRLDLLLGGFGFRCSALALVGSDSVLELNNDLCNKVHMIIICASFFLLLLLFLGLMDWETTCGHPGERGMKERNIMNRCKQQDIGWRRLRRRLVLCRVNVDTDSHAHGV